MAIGNVVHVVRSGFRLSRVKSQRAVAGPETVCITAWASIRYNFMSVDRSSVGDAFMLSPPRRVSGLSLIPLISGSALCARWAA